jgi:outer membrane protein assembly factor BamA
VSLAALLDPRAPRDPGQASQLNLTTSFTYQPTDGTRISLGYKKTKQIRWDTDRVAFDSNIYSLITNWQFSAATFTRLQLDYDTLTTGLRGQFLLGWTPSPGTSVYIGLNEDMTSPGADSTRPLRRNRQTLFIKASYLVRRLF